MPDKLKSRLLLLCILCAAPAVLADDFREWMMQQQRGASQQLQEFQEYKDARDKEFTAFLKAQWKPVEVVVGEVLDEAPKPDVMPVAPPVDKPPPAQPVAEDRPVVKVVVPPPPKVDKPVVAAPIRQPGKQLVVDYYGRKLRFTYDDALRKRMSASITRNTISDHWSALSRTDYEPLLKQLQQQRESLLLTDWAYATLVDRVARKVAGGRDNETAMLSWFLLTKSGYRARIAYRSSRIYLLMPTDQELFEVSYFTFSDRRYYAVDFAGGKLQPGQVYTYDGEYPNTDDALDMQVTDVVASSARIERRELTFEFQGKPYRVEVVYDRGRVGFFSQYPQLDLELYFASGVYPETASPLLTQLADYMQGMDELTAVNFLLRFVQTSLVYATDEQQFGEENYLFPEETLFYPYSDCEDRAVLFAWLVTNLLQLDVVGLDYPGHVATAVRLNVDVEGDAVEHDGQRYIVADPTYINAVAGMTMPEFSRHSPRLITYR